MSRLTLDQARSIVEQESAPLRGKAELPVITDAGLLSDGTCEEIAQLGDARALRTQVRSWVAAWLDGNGDTDFDSARADVEYVVQIRTMRRGQNGRLDAVWVHPLETPYGYCASLMDCLQERKRLLGFGYGPGDVRVVPAPLAGDELDAAIADHAYDEARDREHDERLP